MQRHRIRADIIHTLEDVHLAVGRPAVLLDLPQRGPRPAALRHVPHVEHDRVLRVGFDAPQAHAVAPRPGGREGCGAVGAQDEAGGRVVRRGFVIAEWGGRTCCRLRMSGSGRELWLGPRKFWERERELVLMKKDLIKDALTLGHEWDRRWLGG